MRPITMRPIDVGYLVQGPAKWPPVRQQEHVPLKKSDACSERNRTEHASESKYLGLATPDEEYYVGIDMPSALHPQTILCYELNGKPLPMNQGFPLRLIIPVKYGVKSLKRIGTMYFGNERPPDYWAERGYDYYSGL